MYNIKAKLRTFDAWSLKHSLREHSIDLIKLINDYYNLINGQL